MLMLTHASRLKAWQAKHASIVRCQQVVLIFVYGFVVCHFIDAICGTG